jgi:hypothetical protein
MLEMTFILYESAVGEQDALAWRLRSHIFEKTAPCHLLVIRMVVNISPASVIISYQAFAILGDLFSIGTLKWQPYIIMRARLPSENK